MKEKNVYQLQQEATSDREIWYLDFLDQRGVEYICERCRGLGTRVYPSTATWCGGIGGAAMTNDICDFCWGSGDKYKHWVNLRKLKRCQCQK